MTSQTFAARSWSRSDQPSSLRTELQGRITHKTIDMCVFPGAAAQELPTRHLAAPTQWKPLSKPMPATTLTNRDNGYLVSQMLAELHGGLR